MKRLLREQRGFTLLEMALAVAILGAIGAAFLTAQATGTRATNTLDETVQAEALARSQLEDIKNTAYNTDVGCYAAEDCYFVTVVPPSDYSLAVSTEQIDFGASNALQKIAVTVNRTGSGKPVFSLATFKKK